MELDAERHRLGVAPRGTHYVTRTVNESGLVGLYLEAAPVCDRHFQTDR